MTALRGVVVRVERVGLETKNSPYFVLKFGKHIGKKNSFLNFQNMLVS